MAEGKKTDTEKDEKEYPLYKKIKKEEEDLLKNMLPDIKAALLSLTRNPIYSLCGIKLKQCNGSVGYGIPFSSAFCDTEFIKNHWFPFGYIFEKGIDILCKFLTNSLPETEDMGFSLCRKLLMCIQDEGLKSTVEVLQHEPSTDARKRTRLLFTMAEHLLSRLTLVNSYTLDRTVKESDSIKCLCGCKAKIENKFGDTSIGKQNVWHGYLDAVIEHGAQELPIFIPPEDEVEPPDMPWENTPTEVKFKSLDDKFVEDQMIAETIVFSFLQRKKHPCLIHSLIPLVGISDKDVIFYFYDSENDILLKSTCMKLYTSGAICYPTLIAIWLVVNYQYLGSGVTGELQHISKSNFYNLAGEMINVYKDDLKYGNVLYSTPQRSKFDPAVWDVGRFVLSDYKIPL